MSHRTYDSPLRAEQAEQTRERILEAFCEQLAASRDDFSLPQVAKRAGVSLRTVYHHFPNREAQIEGLSTWIENRLGSEEEALPTHLKDVQPWFQQRIQLLMNHLDLLRASMSAGIAQRVRAQRRRHREAAIEACVAAEKLSPEATVLVSGLLKLLIGAQMGIALIDRYGLSPEQAVKVLNWSIRVLIEAVLRGDGPA